MKKDKREVGIPTKCKHQRIKPRPDGSDFCAECGKIFPNPRKPLP